MSSELELRSKLANIFGSDNKVNEVMEQIGPNLLQRYDDYKHLKGQHVGILFSGGLDTSFWAHFLTHVVSANVTTISSDVGSVTAPANMDEIAARSKEVGAAKHIVIDSRDDLAELGMKAVMAEAQLGNGHGHHPASSLSRVVMVQGALTYAKANGIKAIFHGSNGSQNNPYRFHSAFKHFQKELDFEVEECRPNLGKSSIARNVQQIYLEAANISLPSRSFEENVSHDRNLLGDEWEEAGIANPNNQHDVRKTALQNITVPETPLKLGVKFERGRPIALKIGEDSEFKDMTAREIFETLNNVGLKYHIGIFDYAEGRPINVRAREIHIQPAEHILVKVHNWLKTFTFDDHVNAKLNSLSQHWSRWVMEKNMYVHPERKKMDDVFELFNADLNGEVSFILEDREITNITSPNAEAHMEGTKTPATAEDVDYYTEVTYAVDAYDKAEAELGEFMSRLPQNQRNESWLKQIQELRRTKNSTLERYSAEELVRVEKLEKAVERLDRIDLIVSMR